MKTILSVLVIVFSIATISIAQGKMAVGAHAIVALPMGSFGDVAGTGVGGAVTLEMGFGKNLVGYGQIGYISWSGEEIAGFSYDYSAVPVNAGAKYYFTPGSGFYGTASLGFHFFSVNTDVPTISFGGQVFGGGSASASTSDFTFSVGAGYELPLSPKFALDFGGAYNVISDANYVSLRAGGKVNL